MNFITTLSDDVLLAELGQRLAQLRLNHNWQQHELATEAGVSLRTLSRIEAGEPSQTVNLLRVLRALGLVENLEALVPPPAASPLKQLQLQGKQRKRASRRPGKPAQAAEGAATETHGVADAKPAWQWGSE
jgi:transcriptional regulator with XRE-family HTH domain